MRRRRIRNGCTKIRVGIAGGKFVGNDVGGKAPCASDENK